MKLYDLAWQPLETARLPTISGIYIIRHKTNKKEYIGQSANVGKRVREHRYMKNNYYFHRALKKHGLAAFEVCLFCTGLTSELSKLEVELIAERRTFGRLGYNSTHGGEGAPGVVWSAEMRAAAGAKTRSRFPDGRKRKPSPRWVESRKGMGAGRVIPPELRAKMREAILKAKSEVIWTPERRARISAGQKGKIQPKHTEETKQKMSIARAGRPKSWSGSPGDHPNARVLAVWTQDSLTPRVFSSIKEAMAWSAASRPALTKWVLEEAPNSFGHSWAFL